MRHICRSHEIRPGDQRLQTEQADQHDDRGGGNQLDRGLATRTPDQRRHGRILDVAESRGPTLDPSTLRNGSTIGLRA